MKILELTEESMNLAGFKSHCQRKPGKPHGLGSADSFHILAV